MKIGMEVVRNSQEALSTHNLIILRNFKYWLKLLISHKKVPAYQVLFSLLIIFFLNKIFFYMANRRCLTTNKKIDDICK